MNETLEKQILAAAKTPDELRRAMKLVKQLWQREFELRKQTPQYVCRHLFPLTPAEKWV